MLSLNSTTLQDYNDTPVSVLHNMCPMLFEMSKSCNLTYMSSLIPGDEAAVNDTVNFLARHYRNASGDTDLLQRWVKNRSVGDVTFYTLIAIYAVLICFGSLGNGLVVLAVLRKAPMRSARNMFILNLAVSDLLLCLITMPLTLMEILTRYWPLGRSTIFLCKLFGGLQGVSIFVSTMSITAIALDRYHVIVYPMKKSLQHAEVCIILLCVWALAIFLASPMFIVRQIDHHELNQSVDGLPSSFDYCVEWWAVDHGRAYYSIFSVVCQYLVPILTVSIAYSRITHNLSFRMSSMANRDSSRRERQERRAKRTHTLLVAIALVYSISWIPLNVCNLLSDLLVIREGELLERTRVVYAVCHLIGMSSACSNPILYGWLNDNFRKEFVEIYFCMTPCVTHKSQQWEDWETDVVERTPRNLTANRCDIECAVIPLRCERTQLSRDIPMHQVIEPSTDR